MVRFGVAGVRIGTDFTFVPYPSLLAEFHFPVTCRSSDLLTSSITEQSQLVLSKNVMAFRRSTAQENAMGQWSSDLKVNDS